jgi:hypothetical protein
MKQELNKVRDLIDQGRFEDPIIERLKIILF